MSGVEVTGAPDVQVPSAWKLYRAMVGVGLVCGFLVVTVFVQTLDRIEANRSELLGRAVFAVLPEARERATFVFVEGSGFEPWVPERAPGETDASDPAATAAPAGSRRGPTAASERVHAGFDADGRLVGVAIEASGSGYQDVIDLLYGYSFERQAIVGLEVLASRETPGLGDRIATDPAFQANFEALDVRLDVDSDLLAHAVELVGQGEREQPWQIDAITGATISSMAVADILSRSAARWAPRLRAHRADFERGH